MRKRIMFTIILTIFMCISLSTFAIPRSITLEADTITQEDRSLKTFRILNDIGIKVEYTRAGVFKYVEHHEFAEAKSLCEKVINEITVIRSSLALQRGLTEDDKRFIDKSLGKMKKQLEQIIDDLPFGT